MVYIITFIVFRMKKIQGCKIYMDNGVTARFGFPPALTQHFVSTFKQQLASSGNSNRKKVAEGYSEVPGGSPMAQR